MPNDEDVGFGAFIADAVGSVRPQHLSSSMRTGFIPLPLDRWMLIASNDIPVIAVASGNGGKLASNTAPALIRANAATDKKLTISWAASSSIEITQDISYPPDMDTRQPMVIHLRVKSAGATDTPTIAVGFFEEIGDTNAGGTSAAVSAAIQDLTVSIGNRDLGAYPKNASITIIPGAHTTDALVVTGTYITYTRKP